MKRKFTEKGQALVIVALAAIVLFGFAALAIDGSRAFSDKRHAQNAADTAALASSLAYTRSSTNVISNMTTAAQNRTADNGYDNNGTTNVVTITITDVPKGGCPGDALGKDTKVDIVSYVDTSLARVIGQNQLTNTVTATGRACGYIIAPLFGGNAIVSLNQTNTPCAFDSGNSNAAHWKVQGGGIFSNGCAYSKNGNSVTLDPGECVTSVGTANNFTCMQQSAAISNATIMGMMPENPCDGTTGDVGLPQGSGSTFSNGIYCITNMDALDSKDVVLNNATLYVTDTVFNLKFAGGGGFYGTSTSDPNSPYANYYMIVAYDSTPCPSFTSQTSQVINFRGNGSGTFYGTILAPSACIDFRGNSDPSGMHTQVIGYNVSSNGNAELYFNYKEDENHRQPYQPSVTLWK